MFSVAPRFSVLALAAVLVAAACPRAGQAGQDAAALPPQAALAPSAAIGRITLTLGKADIFRADGQRRSARAGGSIWVGDRVETAAGGHVHIRFVDEALVSVRPNSRLVVEDYHYNPAQVHQSLVRFRLDQGVARAISGAAAEGARERFRLNTPLVAIGVRGTDFVVRADAQQAQAQVNQGAIVMAPLTAPECQAQATGPCGGSAAQWLSAADMPGMLMQYRNYFAQPQLLAQDMPPRDADVQLASHTRSAHSLSPSPVSATTTVTASAQASLTPGSQQEVQTVLAQDTVQQLNVALARPTPPHPTVTPPPTVPPAPAALAWGRWAHAGQGDTHQHDISQLRELASQGRSVTVGNNFYALYRQSDTPSVLGPALGRFDMALQGAQAQFYPGGAAPAQAAQVLGGQLTLDFGAQNFATQLQLSSQATGAQTLQAAGSLNHEGIFIQRQPGLNVGGAVALDGKTAGYFFEQAFGTGNLSGITLWGR
jgi:hypothetical protein